MTQVSTTIPICRPAETIWQVIRDFDAARPYLVGVVACTVAGHGVGAMRTLTHADGSTIVERLERLDAATHRLRYALLTDTPFANCLTSMAVRPLSPHQAELTWSATFEANGLPTNEASVLLEGALAANCLALKQFMEVDWP